MKEVILIPSYEPDNKLIDLINSIDKERFDIIVVNDGSNICFDKIFNKIKKKVQLISYKTNMGKGYALKKGIEYIKNKYNKDYIVITMDSDGQHKIEDAIKLSEYVKNNLYTYTLGMRKRGANTPIRSKIGNKITKGIFHLVTGINIYDTQTGLRCFSYKLTDFMLNVEGNRFEYEMNLLLESSKNNIKLHEIEIETIYHDKNKGTHFKTIRDSYLIYKDIIKFSLSSIISFIIDYSMFTIFSLFIKNISLCNIFARIISALVNYTINRKYVFQSKNNLYKSIISYILLAVFILILNTFLLNIFVYKIMLNKFLAKVIVEIILFIFNFIIQKRFIFRKKVDQTEQNI